MVSFPFSFPRRLFLGIILFLLVSLFLGLGWSNSRGTLRAKLRIETLPSPADVFLNDEKIGTTPLEKEGLLAGEARVRIEKGERRWQGGVKLISGQETALFVGLSSLSASHFVSQVVLESSGDKRTELAVITRPVPAEVSLDGVVWGTAPLLKDNLAPGSHSLAFSASGWVAKGLTLNLSLGWRAVVEVDLFPLPFSESLLLPSLSFAPFLAKEVVVEPISSWRQEGKGAVRYLPWRNWRLLKLSPAQFLKTTEITRVLPFLLDYYRFFAGEADLPFHYLVDGAGQIYETSLGGRESVISFEGVEREGEAWVAVFTNEEPPFPTLKNSLAALEREIFAGGTLKASLEGELEEVTLEPGGQALLEARFKNTGSRVWYNEGSRLVILATSPSGRSSSFFTPDNWFSRTAVSLADEKAVVSQAFGRFDFVATAPLLPGEYREVFRLVEVNETGRILSTAEGGEVTFLLKVRGGSLVYVTILPTGLDYLNVRAGPGRSFPIVTQVHPGEKHVSLAESGGWIKLRLPDGQEGWVKGVYVKK